MKPQREKLGLARSALLGATTLAIVFVVGIIAELSLTLAMGPRPGARVIGYCLAPIWPGLFVGDKIFHPGVDYIQGYLEVLGVALAVDFVLYTSIIYAFAKWRGRERGGSSSVQRLGL